eukprot:GHRQ01028665.1.p1 GENE.GHRQ01028665.1~~GHRQ01028665.1.p1  ORF type:complete len:176 (+),score=41.36 GHRQ01028665.1:11-538(+)
MHHIRARTAEAGLQQAATSGRVTLVAVPALRRAGSWRALSAASTMAATVPALDLKSIGAAYASGATNPSQLVQALYPKLAAAKGMFIHLAPLEQLLQRAAALEAQVEGSRGALWGVPFATKDNVDVAGMPTTAGCPSFSYTPQSSAAAVQALEDAGGQYMSVAGTCLITAMVSSI